MNGVSSNHQYEKVVKHYLLDNRHLFMPKRTNQPSKDTVWFEKAILRSHTIADCLIFSELFGEIGVEIKTAHDTTKRLAKQLADYVQVCDYVWVLIDDKQLTDTLSVLDNLQYNFIGVISYTEVGEQLMGGTYRLATANPYQNVAKAYQMLWATEIKVMADALAKRKGQHVHATKKRELIWYIIQSLGAIEAKRYLVDFVISDQHDPNKVLNQYHFSGGDDNNGPVLF